MKKALLEKKKEEKKTKSSATNNKTYAAIASAAAQKTVEETQTKQTPVTMKIKTDVELRTTVIILHAHIHNMICNGTYATELNRNLVAQGLPPIDAPDNPNSARLFNVEIDEMFTEGQKKDLLSMQEDLRTEMQWLTEQREEVNKLQQKKDDELNKKLEEEKEKMRLQLEATHKQKLPGPSTSENQAILDKQLSKEFNIRFASDVGIKLYTDDKRLCKNISPLELKKFTTTGRIKIELRYGTEYSMEEIMEFISHEKVRELGVNIELVDTSSYKKIRNSRERTPPHADSEKKSKP
jgi:hypothetical protein